MIANNTRLHMSYVDYKIVHDGVNWFAWYNEPMTKALETAITENK